MKRTLPISDISLPGYLRQPVRQLWREGVPGRGGGDSHGPPVGGNMTGMGESLDQTLPHPPGEFSPPTALNTPYFHDRRRSGRCC